MPSTSRILSMSSAALIAATGVAAQVSTPWTDPNTGITFSSNTHESGFSWGIATPKTITTDFLAYMAFPVTEGGGWGGVSLGLGGRMADTALVVAWPNAGAVVSGFRKADGYSNPAGLTGSQQLIPIEKGTYTNATHTSLTFLCKGCVDASLTFPATANITVMGFAMSTEAPKTIGDPTSELTFHSAFGQAGFDVPGSGSADFDTWAALASGGTGSTPAPPAGTDTATPPAGTDTATPPAGTDTATPPAGTDTPAPPPPADPTAAPAPPTTTDPSVPTSTDAPTDPTDTATPTDTSVPTPTDTTVPTPTSTCAAKRKRAAKLRLRK